MKRPFFILAFGVILIIIVFSFVFSSQKAKILPGYEIVFSRSLGDGLVLSGFVAKDLTSNPQSLLAIFRGKNVIYRFSPVVPKSINYPRPLMIEKADVVKIKQGPSYIVTSWGETGADYFGTHPIVISCGINGFKAVSFYKGDISSDPMIKSISWTQKDFDAANYFNKTEKVKTILTQGVSVAKDNQVELNFYGDDLPHAAEHKMVMISLPLP
ncbi:MAG: hypothetical protein KKA31_04470 [Candidatus Margulisbacteria bacterium]|nr:hypothetical protein [Candidatus Margulisiibacteriota bacterium]